MAKLDQSKTLDGAIDEREVLRSMNIAQQPRRRAGGGGSDLEFHQLGHAMATTSRCAVR